MGLFSDRLVEDMRRLPGGEHTFLRQVCGVHAGRQRSALEAMVEVLPPPLLVRAKANLTSLNNRKFFQGYAEVAAASFLERGRLRVHDLTEPGAYLAARSVSGQALNVGVVSFIHKGRAGADQATIKRLVAALDRVGSKQRLAVIVHARLPDDFDTEEVRRAVDTWLSEVERGMWQGRYATFIDEKRGIQLEFGLTGRTARRGSRVCFVLGPFLGPAALAVVEPRILNEMNRYHLGAHSGEPLLLFCVGDQPWNIGRGTMREFLYGQARSTVWQQDGAEGSFELSFDDMSGASLFHDPVYSDLTGVVWIGREGDDPTRVRAEVFLNPWARVPLDPELLPAVPTLAPVGREGREVRLHWRGDRREPRLDLI
ncbi:MAG: hypothetical protein ABIO70_28190 [Pseudomonadota bacterium]